jgi:hypothetical protein
LTNPYVPVMLRFVKSDDTPLLTIIK